MNMTTESRLRELHHAKAYCYRSEERGTLRDTWQRRVLGEYLPWKHEAGEEWERFEPYPKWAKELAWFVPNAEGAPIPRAAVLTQWMGWSRIGWHETRFDSRPEGHVDVVVDKILDVCEVPLVLARFETLQGIELSIALVVDRTGFYPKTFRPDTAGA